VRDFQGNRSESKGFVLLNFRHFVMGLEEFMPLIVGRRFCATEQGRLAIVPAFAEMGDEIWTFSGTPNPFVLRRDEAASTGRNIHLQRYQIIGVSSVDGIMRGELRKADLILEIIYII